jgi:hypothetical protein
VELLTKCPECGFESNEIRCPRCNALKVVGCDGVCSACTAACPDNSASPAESKPRTEKVGKTEKSAGHTGMHS